MHKRSHLTVTEGRTAPAPTKARTRAPRVRGNRRRRDWNKTLKGFAALLAVAEVAAVLCAPAFRVTRVRVDGAQTISPEQVFAEARVPEHTNIFWMLRQPLTKRIAADPVIDHVSRSIRLPNLLVLTVTERQPFATLAAGGQFWLLDRKGVPYSALDRPAPGLPIIQAAANVLPDQPALGRPLGTSWLADAYRLLDLTRRDADMDGAKIVVDQNRNMCLNRKNALQIRLGQPDSLPWKMSLADAALSAYGGALARRAAYIDVSCPQQPVWRPRAASSETSLTENNREPNGTEPGAARIN